MPLDSLTVSGLRKELYGHLLGARVDKIQQPAADAVLLSVRSERENRKLLISVTPGNARVNITDAVYENPVKAPMFCMLLRKYLTGARILDITQPGFERMLEFHLTGLDEMGSVRKLRLEIELIGSASNLVLVSEDGHIIDCIRRYGSVDSEKRSVLPGLLYEYPTPQNKRLLPEADEEYLQGRLTDYEPGMPLEKFIMSILGGISPLIARELSWAADDNIDKLPKAVLDLKAEYEDGNLHPVMLVRDGQPFDITCLPIRQYGLSVQNLPYPEFSGLMEAFYAQRFHREMLRRASHELVRTAAGSRDRMERKLAGQRQELKKTEDRDVIRRRAELITANIYRIPKGARQLECEDYYEENCPTVLIPLDPLLTPQQNAAKLFKQYNKLKSAQEHLTGLIAEAEQQLEYLNSVVSEIERAESEKDLSDIRAELKLSGYIRAKKNEKPEKLKPRKPLQFLSPDGYVILVGRSNTENDDLTLRKARRTDIWLHAQKQPGSHVIICCEDTLPPDATILYAAGIAAWYSQGREMGKVAVDYTAVRHVRKPSGALPGKVIYTDYKTVLAEAAEPQGGQL